MPLIKFNLENKNKNQIKTEILNKFNKIQNIVNNDRNYNEILYNIINHSLSKKRNIKINLDKYGNYKIIDNSNNKVLSGGLYNSLSIGGLGNNNQLGNNQEKQEENTDDGQEENTDVGQQENTDEDQEENTANDQEENPTDDQEENTSNDQEENPTDDQEESTTDTNVKGKIENAKSKLKNAQNILDSVDGTDSKEDTDKDSKEEKNSLEENKSSEEKKPAPQNNKGNGFLSFFGIGNKSTESKEGESDKNNSQSPNSINNTPEKFGFNDVTKGISEMNPTTGESKDQTGGYYSSDDENYLDDFNNQTLMFHDDDDDNLMSHFNNMTNKEYLNQLNYQDLRTIMKNNQMRLTNNGSYYNKKDMVNKIYNFYR